MRPPSPGALVVALLVVGLGAAARWAARRSSACSVQQRLDPSPPIGAKGRRPATAPTAVARALEEAGIDAPAGPLWRRWMTATGVAVLLAWLVAGPATAGVAGLVAVGGPAVGLRALRGRGDRRVEASLPGVLEEVARALRAGSSLLQALRAASLTADGHLAADVGTVVAAVDRGGGLADELDRWAQRRPVPGVRLAVTALALGAETGGPQARAVDAVAATLRDREAVRHEAHALASQARASAAVMGVTPILFAVIATALDPRVAHVLLATPLGLTCLVTGLTLDAVAGLWMARITGATP